MRRVQIGKPKFNTTLRRPGRDVVLEKLQRRQRREMINKGLIPDPKLRPPRFKFNWVCDSSEGVVFADNQSLARSLIKKELGIPKKQRLPLQTVITREPNEE